MLNNCLLTGNLGADPEVFYSSEGEPVATFNLAFRSSKKKTGWIKVTCFKKLSEIVSRHLHKGARIAVIGTLDQHKWETDEGQILFPTTESLLFHLNSGQPSGDDRTKISWPPDQDCAVSALKIPFRLGQNS